MTSGNAIDDTEVLFVNHSSILIRKDGHYLLTDPWFQRPAFGSWLPSFPSYIHPAYLASLGDKLSILISHAHDDHCDDEVLGIFDRTTNIITARFSSQSVVLRLKKLGFKNITSVDSDGCVTNGGFDVKGYIDANRSLDDAIYSINTGDGLVLHCNDNWFEFDEDTRRSLAEEVAPFDRRSILFMTQTNSASGFPLNYRCFTDAEKVQLLKSKVTGMVVQGLRNAKSLGLKSMGSYAGFANVYVHGKPEYGDLGLTPTARYIKRSLLSDSEEGKRLLQEVDVLDYYPGDSIHLKTGRITKAFISSNDFEDTAMKAAASRFYEVFNLLERCDTFSTDLASEPFDPRRLDFFLSNFNNFVVRKVDLHSLASKTILGKSLEIHLSDLHLSRRLEFGRGLTEAHGSPPNKRLTVDSRLMAKVLSGSILFENLYTGYEGEWERFPSAEYNRDITMFIVMYSYFYKNSLASVYRPTECLS